jgi:F-box-like
VTIESLPDDVLLDVFDFYQTAMNTRHSWHVLIHVCRRWRYVVFASPRRLNLRLFCNSLTPVRKMLDIWPRLPISTIDLTLKPDVVGVNIIAALERHDCVCEINLWGLTSPLLERLLKVMQVPFPALTYLDLKFSDQWPRAPVLPDTFLGGSAPRLQSLMLWGIPFPELPKLLSSCHDLVDVQLRKIPTTGYISPDAMATCLSPLTRLQFLDIGFEPSNSRPDLNRPPPPRSTRVALPALTRLEFRGSCEYLDNLVARIDTPAINFVKTEFFNQPIFSVPQFVQYIGRTEMPRSLKEARLCFTERSVQINLGHLDPLETSIFQDVLSIWILNHVFDTQVSGSIQICNQISPFFSNIRRLDIPCENWLPWALGWQSHTDRTQWSRLFRPFIAVQILHVGFGLHELMASVLQELTGERVMEVLPALRSLSLVGFRSDNRVVQKALKSFVTARQQSNHPVIVHPRIV